MVTFTDTFNDVSIRIAAAIVFVGLIVVLLGLFRDRSRGRARCPKCWFDLHAQDMPSDGVLVCPECGKRVRKKRSLHRTRRRKKAVLLGLLIAGVGIGYPKVDRDGWLSVVPMRVLVRFASGAGEAWFDEAMHGVAANHWLTDELARRDEASQMSDSAWEAMMWRVRTDLETSGLYGLKETDHAVHEQFIAANLPSELSTVRRRDVLAMQNPSIQLDLAMQVGDAWLDKGIYFDTSMSDTGNMSLELGLELLFVRTTHFVRPGTGGCLYYGDDGEIIVTTKKVAMAFGNTRTVIYDLRSLNEAERSQYPMGYFDIELDSDSIIRFPGTRIASMLEGAFVDRRPNVSVCFVGGRWLVLEANPRLHFEFADALEAYLDALRCTGGDSTSDELREAFEVLEVLESQPIHAGSSATLDECLNMIQAVSGLPVTASQTELRIREPAIGDTHVDLRGVTTGWDLLDVVATYASPRGAGGWDIAHGQIVIGFGSELGWLTRAYDLSRRFGPVPLNVNDALKHINTHSAAAPYTTFEEDFYTTPYRVLGHRASINMGRMFVGFVSKRFHRMYVSSRVGRSLVLTTSPREHYEIVQLLDRLARIESGDWSVESERHRRFGAIESTSETIEFWDLSRIRQAIQVNEWSIGDPPNTRMRRRENDDTILFFESVIAPEVDWNQVKSNGIKIERELSRALIQSYSPTPQPNIQAFENFVALRSTPSFHAACEAFMTRLNACLDGDWTQEERIYAEWESSVEPEFAAVGLFRLEEFVHNDSGSSDGSRAADLDDIVLSIESLVEWEFMPYRAYPRAMIVRDVVVVRAPIRLLRTLRDRHKTLAEIGR